MKYELMPVGTREQLRHTAKLLRSYEAHHREIAQKTGAKTGREEKAERNAKEAEKLEALLAAAPDASCFMSALGWASIGRVDDVLVAEFEGGNDEQAG